MSGAFFGIFHSNQAPADAAALATMDRVMAGWGPDAHGQLIHGSLALAGRLLKVTVEDESEQLPLQDGPHILAARVRLDNRRELCARLGFVNHQSLPDSRLILEAYRQYGLDCVQYLMGDWSFAIWDDTTQTLMIARDASGNTGVYYWWDGKKLVFSNGIRAILVHPDFQRQLDPLVLAGFLTMYGDPEVSDATLYQGIKKILPGQLLLMRQGGLQIRRWWQPEQLGFLRYDRVEDCYADFVTLYDEVVGECLRIGGGKVAATLSGGLDSGSVVSLAAPRLQAHGQSLSAFVHAPLYEPALAGSSRTGNELALAQATADHVGNTQVESGASHGLDVRDPTRDRRLVEFCWRVPDAAFWAHGRMRGLIREGMRTHLPASVLSCKAKGLQSADVLTRYQTEAASIQEVLEDAAKLPIGSCLDFSRIWKTANSIVGGEMKNLLSLHVFGRAVQTALFFRQADL